MEEMILMKDQVAKLYKELSGEYNFFAPVKEKGYIAYRKITNPEEIELNYFNSKIPPKEILFPQMEVLFEFETDGKNVTEIKDRKDLDEKNILFGIRPCDAHSFDLLEKFFAFGDFQDEIFLKKRENSLIIGIGCNSPKSTCFCTSIEGHPFQKDDMDIFLVDLGEKYLVEGITDKGIKLIQKLSWLSKASKADVKNAQELAKKAEDLITTKLDLTNTSKILESNFGNEIWKEVSENCLGCGSCTFLCPTCTCFDVIDENDQYKNRGRRIRIWDTCQFCLYTLHTSGHNPRNSNIERCRNRILHKFSYYPLNYDIIGCVGCGRCIQVCPVNNDLRTIINKINNIKPKEEENVSA